MGDILLEVQNLKKYFKTPRGMLHAVDDVSFTLERGKTLGIVGESGCGKSTTGRTILRLEEPTSGKVIFEGKDITTLGKRDMRALRKDMQLIFQDPFSSLDPRFSGSFKSLLICFVPRILIGVLSALLFHALSKTKLKIFDLISAC